MTYIPQQCPDIAGDTEALRRWVQDEFLRVAQGLVDAEELRLVIRYAAPAGPVDGMVVFADGTTWNPGSGRGAYERRSGTWVKL